MQADEKRKVILYFTDCEGTICDDGSYKYDQDKLFKLFDEMLKLEISTGARINLHLISPTSHRQLMEFMRKFDKDILEYYKKESNSGVNSIKSPCEIEQGGAYPEASNFGREVVRDRDEFYDMIENLNIPSGKSIKSGCISEAKQSYVKKWVDLYKQSKTKDLVMAIYSGNGLGDEAAVKFINDEDRGFTICPSNSTDVLKRYSSFKSDKPGILGVIDGFKCINRELDKRKGKNQSKDRDEER